MCIRIYISNFKKNKTKKTRRQKKQKKLTEEEKRIPVENVMGDDGIFCKFTLFF